MFNVKTLLGQAMLALALAGSPLGALAAPVSFHVDLDTTTLDGPGYVDLQFGALGDAPPTTVTVSNLTGGFGPIDYIDDGVLPNADGSYTISNSPGLAILLSFNAVFGGQFGFDLAFADDYSTQGGIDRSAFNVSLLDVDYLAVGGGAVASFDLTPGIGIRTGANLAYASIVPLATAVPEPSDWLLMGTGLALLGLTLRRRAGR